MFINTFAFLFLLPSTSWAECVNPFAGCELVNNTTPFNGTLTRARVEVAPSPSTPTIDNSLALLEAGVSDTPWRCNTSIAWGDIVWNQCRAPDTTICVIEPMVMSPSPYTRRRRTDSISPSPVSLTPCRTSVALSDFAEGWCKEGAICEVTCTTDLSTRRIFDMYVHTADHCPTGIFLTVSPTDAALLWMIAFCTMIPALCLSLWRMFVLTLRSKVHWRNYWVGISAFSSLIFKWPIGRVIAVPLIGSISLLLLSWRKFDKIDNHPEEASLIGIDLFVGACYSLSTYLWFIGTMSIPLALGHRAMSIPLNDFLKQLKSNKSNNSNNQTQRKKRCRLSCMCFNKNKKNQGNDSTTAVIDISDNSEHDTMTDDTILKRLGMRSRHKEKHQCMQTMKRNTRTVEIRKHEAIQDIKAPMKPSDRIGCSHALYRKTWKIQSFLYLVVLALSSIPSAFSVLFDSRPSPVFWSLGVRVMHGGFAVVLLL